MINKIQLYMICLVFFQALPCFGQDDKVKIPNSNDRYAKYVKKLELGDTNIDYTDFRHSFLESSHRVPYSSDCVYIKEDLIAAAKEKRYSDVVYIAIVMLNIDYTNLFAHKCLQEAYKSLGDKVRSKRYHTIESGLLNSIINSGDGTTCETAWHVTQWEEESFVLYIFNSTITDRGNDKVGDDYCDKITATNKEGNVKTYYFQVYEFLGDGDLSKD